MNIKWAILVSRYLPDVGGNTKYIEYYSQTLVRQDNEVHIFTTTRDPSLLKYEVINGVKIHRLLVKRGNAGVLRFSTTKLQTKLFLEIDNKIKFDILNPHGAFLINYNKLREDLRIIHTLHGVLTYEYLYDLKKIITTLDLSGDGLKELVISPVKLPVCYIRELYALLNAEKIIVMSNYVRNVVMSIYPFVRINRLFVSRVGVDFNLFKPTPDKAFLRNKYSMPLDSIIFFTARRLVFRMGIENLVRAVAKLRDLDKGLKFKLLIAGKGQLYNSIKNLIRKLDLDDYIIMLGFVSDDDLIEYYQLSDAFILPTEELEGFGLVSLEALACNIPVISTPAGANPEVSGYFCNDLMTKTPKVGDIVKKMKYFCDNLQLFKNKSYVDLIKNRYSWDIVVDDLKKGII